MTIDSNMYQYYESLHRQAEAYVSPYAEPVPVKSNIRGGLGIWGDSRKIRFKRAGSQVVAFRRCPTINNRSTETT